VEIIDQLPGKKDDAAMVLDTYFQTPSAELILKITDFHNDLMFFLVVTVLFISYLLVRRITFFISGNSATPRAAIAHYTPMEKV